MSGIHSGQATCMFVQYTHFFNLRADTKNKGYYIVPIRDMANTYSITCNLGTVKFQLSVYISGWLQKAKSRQVYN